MLRSVLPVVLLAILAPGCRERDPAAEVARAEPSATVTVAELTTSLADDALGFIDKYKGKVLIVEGIVHEVDSDPSLPNMSLATHDEADAKYAAHSIHCSFPSVEALPKTTKGETLRVKGRCDSLAGSVFLDDCIAVD